MQSSANKPQEVKNILIRHSCSEKILPGTTFQHPEKSHLLRYFPKYYKNLTLEITKEHPCHSRIKSIKKLKKFTGYFKKNPSRKRWTHLLGNVRKEIEEIPQIIPIYSLSSRLTQLCWAKLMPWKMKFFPNIRRLFLPKREADNGIEDFDDSSLVKRSFLKSLRRLRKVKTLEILTNRTNDQGEKLMLGKLNRMNQFHEKVENVRMSIENCDTKEIQGFFKSKNLASKITSLVLSFGLEAKFEQNFVGSLQMCKDLRFLSVSLHRSMDGNAEFSKFLTSLQDLPSLLGLEFGLPKGVKSYWSHFKPQSSLRYLKLKVDVGDMIQEGVFGTEEGDVVAHWDNIEQLDELELIFSHTHIQEVSIERGFITEVLKKVCKLRSFKCSRKTAGMTSGRVRGEPFEVEEVPHLYESLQKFEYSLTVSSGGSNVEFDMKTMRVFQNLKEFKLHEIQINTKNIEEMVDLLQTNQKERDLPLLTLVSESVKSVDWFKDIMEKISKTKKSDRNLKISIDLNFCIFPCDCLEGLLRILKSVGEIKGLFVTLRFSHSKWNPVFIEAFRKMMKKYDVELRNLVVKMDPYWIFRRLNGEKEQYILIDAMDDDW